MEGEWETHVLRVTSSNPTPSKTFFFNIYFEDLFCKFAKKEKYIFRQKKKGIKILSKRSLEGFPVEFKGDIPVKFVGISL
jgi:hypothetical protein